MTPVPGNDARPRRALRSLDGLSVGDAFGEQFFGPVSVVEERIAARPRRGYGAMAHDILREIGAGAGWRDTSSRAFSGEGSMGNGGAMRVAPLGAWFCDDIERLVSEARASAQVTHFHGEGQAGAVAVAVAAGCTCGGPALTGIELLDKVLRHTPPGETRDGIARATRIALDNDPRTAASFLGCGLRVTAPDTVPFAIWSAARALDDYEEALWSTVAVGGDMDTNCAIVGGIVAARESVRVPESWLASREALK